MRWVEKETRSLPGGHLSGAISCVDGCPSEGSVAGYLLTTQNILTTPLRRVGVWLVLSPSSQPPLPAERETYSVPSVFLRDGLEPGLPLWHLTGGPPPKVTKRTLVKTTQHVKKIQKLFSPFDCYLLVTIFVKNITSVFEKRFSLFIEYGKINSTKRTVHAPLPPQPP